MINSVTQRVSASRGWAIAVGIGAAVLAGLLLLVYLNSYRESVAGETAPTSVLVAKSLILKGTSGTVIAAKEMYQGASFPNKEVKVGAIADPAVLSGRVAVNDILPGQQLTTSDFSTSTTDAVNTKITGRQRAISVPVDAIHGSLAQLAPGDHIDVYIGIGGGAGREATVKLFRPDVLVLSAPQAQEGNVILRVDTRDAADMAFAADNGTLWFVLRPQAGAKPTARDSANLQTVLAGR
jgi:Flp pilus assembly protein CpaB